MKKAISILLALLMIMSLATTAFATAVDGTDFETKNTSVTIENADAHSFNAYEILTATVSADGENISYSVNAKYRSVLQSVVAEAKDVEDATTVTDADIIDYISKLSGEGVRTFCNDVYAAIKNATIAVDTTVTGGTAAELGKGYWLFVDVTELDDEGKDPDALSKIIADTTLADTLTITAKLDTPTVDKEVLDINDSEDNAFVEEDWEDGWWNDYTAWDEDADHDVGDVVPFRIKVDLPNDIESYSEGYYVEITDTMSKGLTYQNDAVIMIGTSDVTDDFEVGYSTHETTGVTTLTIQIDDVTEVAENDVVIYVYYTCVLNEDAVLGVAGNPNDVDLEYSNEPDDDGHGTTPKDTVIVFTYEPIVNKVDSTSTPLDGAGFTLYKKIDGAWVEIEEIEAAEGLTEFGFKGIDDGDYKLEETTVPDGYNKIDDIYFTVEATHDNETLTVLTAEGTIGENGEKITITTNITTGEAVGELEMDVVNKSGTELPETGGIGTTLFYVFGGILVVAAVVLLVTKKRMSVAE